MKTFLTLTFLVLLSNACGSIDDDEKDSTSESSIKTVSTNKSDAPNSEMAEDADMCRTTVNCVGECGSNKSCAKKCLTGLSGRQIEQANILDRCLEYRAGDCVTESCEQKECYYAMDICSGEKKYGCAQIIECADKCLTLRCENECRALATNNAIDRLDEIGECGVRYCSESEDVNSCLRVNCEGELTACLVN